LASNNDTIGGVEVGLETKTIVEMTLDEKLTLVAGLDDGRRQKLNGEMLSVVKALSRLPDRVADIEAGIQLYATSPYVSAEDVAELRRVAGVLYAEQVKPLMDLLDSRCLASVILPDSFGANNDVVVP